MITLTSDFGLKDPYVAEMKGVILNINPNATLVDITHEIKAFDLRAAAFTLASAAPYFPAGTVHLAVIDPGVGTKRRAIIVETKTSFFVGPDNGILLLAAKNQKIKKIHQITNSKLMLPNVSGTFHGRDIFAPAAAHLDKGIQPVEFGPEIKDPVTPDFAQATLTGDSINGEVLHVDSFGDIITNIRGKDIHFEESKRVQVEFASKTVETAFVKAYAEAKPREPVILVGSHGFLEISLNKESAAAKFHVEAGDKIKVKSD